MVHARCVCGPSADAPPRLAGIASSVDDEAMERLSALASLEELDISCHDRVTDKGLLHLCKCPKLRSVSLARNSRVTMQGMSCPPQGPAKPLARHTGHLDLAPIRWGDHPITFGHCLVTRFSVYQQFQDNYR